MQNIIKYINNKLKIYIILKFYNLCHMFSFNEQ